MERAAKRYRQSAGLRPEPAKASGKWLLEQVVGKLVLPVQMAQQKAIRDLTQAGWKSPGAVPLTALPADVLAVIAATVVFRAAVVGGPLSALARVAKDISSVARDEIEYRNWVAEQKVANTLARKEGEWTHVDLLARFQRTYPEVLQRVWAVWRRKVNALREEKWPDPVQVSFGSALVDIICRAAPEHFSTVLQKSGGKTTRYIALSGKTREMLKDVEERAAVARPLKMPMIMRPLSWGVQP